MFGSVPVISSQSRVASTPYNLVTSLTGLSVSSPSPSPQTFQAKQLFSSSPAMVNTTSQPGPVQPSDCSQTLQVHDNYNIIVETNLTRHKFQDLYYVSCRYFGLKPFVKTKREHSNYITRQHVATFTDSIVWWLHVG